MLVFRCQNFENFNCIFLPMYQFKHHMYVGPYCKTSLDFFHVLGTVLGFMGSFDIL